LSGLRRESMKPEHLARAAFEGMLCSLADAMDGRAGPALAARPSGPPALRAGVLLLGETARARRGPRTV
ncbi:hypothetical protein ABZX67_33280, partial [Streptomyces sp. NPDC003036]